MEDIYTGGSNNDKVPLSGFFCCCCCYCFMCVCVCVLFIFISLIKEINLKFGTDLTTVQTNGLNQQLNILAYLRDTLRYLVINIHTYTKPEEDNINIPNDAVTSICDVKLE